MSKREKKDSGFGIFLYAPGDYTFYPDDNLQNGVRQVVKFRLVPEGGAK